MKIILVIILVICAYLAGSYPGYNRAAEDYRFIAFYDGYKAGREFGLNQGREQGVKIGIHFVAELQGDDTHDR